MNVVLQTPTQLVVHDGVLKTVVLGAIFAAAGGGLISLWLADPSDWSGNAGPWLIYLVGGVFIAVGIALLALSADRRFVIDRSAGTQSLRFAASGGLALHLLVADEFQCDFYFGVGVTTGGAVEYAPVLSLRQVF